ncbi:MAG: hypothetical protein DWQ37_20990 [Planctomycetota bacterium]|nr:MAG: hypothetical protein DWQ37_20990 [Planctomycetota bacterium]
MNAATLMPPIALLIVVSLLLPTAFGLAALWAARGRAGWFWRWAPLVLGLAVLAPLGAIELIVLFGAQAATVMSGLALARIFAARAAWRRAQRENSEHATRARSLGIQFRLREALWGVLLAAGALALVRLAPPQALVSLGFSSMFPPWLVAGLVLGAATLAAMQLALGGARSEVRVLVFGSVTLIAGIALLACLIWAVDSSERMIFWGPLLPGAAGAALHGLLLAPGLALARGSGWMSRAAPPADASVAALATPARSRSTQTAARAGLGMVALVSAWILVSVYWTVLPPQVPDVATASGPNAPDELQRVASLFNWASVPKQDYEAATAQDCRTFTRQNAEALAALRRALELPHTSVDLTDAYAWLTRYPEMHNLACALAAEGKAWEGDGNDARAASSYIAVIRLANANANGGLMDDDLQGDGIAQLGIVGLARIIPKLDADELDALARELEQAAAAREPYNVVVERDRTWRFAALSWIEHLTHHRHPVAHMEVFANARKCYEAHVNLLIAEMAVRRHVLIEGAPPDALESLVPEYLSQVPEDPYGQGPLVYHRQGDTYSLYSVGRNGVDDGGQRVSFDAAIWEGKGDLFFDAMNIP